MKNSNAVVCCFTLVACLFGGYGSQESGQDAEQKDSRTGELLRIDDGRDWQFVNSRWHDTDNGELVGERIGDGDGLQGYRDTAWRSRRLGPGRMSRRHSRFA